MGWRVKIFFPQRQMVNTIITEKEILQMTWISETTFNNHLVTHK